MAAVFLQERLPIGIRGELGPDLGPMVQIVINPHVRDFIGVLRLRMPNADILRIFFPHRHDALESLQPRCRQTHFCLVVAVFVDMTVAERCLHVELRVHQADLLAPNQGPHLGCIILDPFGVLPQAGANFLAVVQIVVRPHVGDLVQGAEFGEPVAFAGAVIVAADHHGAFLGQFQELRNLAGP